jgi:hypothetical protein
MSSNKACTLSSAPLPLLMQDVHSTAHSWYTSPPNSTSVNKAQESKWCTDVRSLQPLTLNLQHSNLNPVLQCLCYQPQRQPQTQQPLHTVAAAPSQHALSNQCARVCGCCHLQTITARDAKGAAVTCSWQFMMQVPSIPLFFGALQAVPGALQQRVLRSAVALYSLLLRHDVGGSLSSCPPTAGSQPT